MAWILRTLQDPGNKAMAEHRFISRTVGTCAQLAPPCMLWEYPCKYSAHIWVASAFGVCSCLFHCLVGKITIKNVLLLDSELK